MLSVALRSLDNFLAYLQAAGRAFNKQFYNFLDQFYDWQTAVGQEDALCLQARSHDTSAFSLL